MMTTKILFVIVLYNQKIYESNTYKSFALENSEINLLIYDNSPVSQHSDQEFDENVKYIHNSKNPGLSFAYNRAAEYAKEKGFQWLLLLDQDTTFGDKILHEYQEAIAHNPYIKLFVPPMAVNNGLYMSPVPVKRHVTKLQKEAQKGVVDSAKYTAINSGIMINLEAFFEVGGYNENVRLDFSDFQFMERFSKRYDSFYVLETICQQEFSAEVQTPKQMLQRFAIFCESLKNCSKGEISAKIDYLYIVIKRMLSLCVKTKSLKPITIFIKNYL